MKQFCLFVSCFIAIFHATAQPQLQWFRVIGGNNVDQATRVLYHSSGSVALFGSTSSSGFAGSGYMGGEDAVYIPLSSGGAGNTATCYGGTNNEYLHTVLPMANGNYLGVGVSYSNDGLATGSRGGADVYLLEITPGGTGLSHTKLGGSGIDIGTCGRALPDGTFLIGGLTNSTDGDLNHNEGIYDIWVTQVKPDSSYGLRFNHSFGSSGDDRPNDLMMASDGAIIVIGRAAAADADFTSLNHHGGNAEAFLTRITTNGISVTKTSTFYGGGGSDYFQNIFPSSDGGYMLFGGTSSNDGQVSGNHGDYDFWAVKLSAAGNIQWQKCYGGSGADFLYSAVALPDGGFVLTGATSSADGDVTGKHGGSDAWIVRINSTGDLMWQRCIGSDGDDLANSLAASPAGEVLVAGTAKQNGGDFVIGTTAMDNMWVAKFTFPLSVAETVSYVPLSFYPNPTNSVIHFSAPSGFGAAGGSVRIVSADGRLVQEYAVQVSNNLVSVSAHGLTPGLYWLEYREGSKTTRGKFIRQ